MQSAKASFLNKVRNPSSWLVPRSFIDTARMEYLLEGIDPFFARS
jgi:hypothetical protein